MGDREYRGPGSTALRRPGHPLASVRNVGYSGRAHRHHGDTRRARGPRFDRIAVTQASSETDVVLTMTPTLDTAGKRQAVIAIVVDPGTANRPHDRLHRPKPASGASVFDPRTVGAEQGGAFFDFALRSCFSSLPSGGLFPIPTQPCCLRPRRIPVLRTQPDGRINRTRCGLRGRQTLARPKV